MPETLPARAHVVAGGFPPGAHGGHDHDYARLRLLEILADHEVHASVGNDFTDVERWLPLSRVLITYVAGPFPTPDQTRAIRQWMEEGGRWIGLHGTAGGKATRVAGSNRRRMERMDHHEALGGFFINHPPVRRFRVDVHDAGDTLTDGLPEAFETVDEPYMIEVREPEKSRLLLTSELGPDPMPDFGFAYDEDTALFPDGKTRALGYTRDIGKGGVTYIALGHAHSPTTNAQPFVDPSVDPEGKTPPYLRVTWETEAYQRLLHNTLEWGMKG